MKMFWLKSFRAKLAVFYLKESEKKMRRVLLKMQKELTVKGKFNNLKKDLILLSQQKMFLCLLHVVARVNTEYISRIEVI